eukprot:TRINITY_DN64662_c0_g1_i1.p1 TRINITY_DN64662_c0_g1~~TRINITY_DN64662_c0_g1_i1.p1  ORF type:complete len:130 (+),score=25.64 TRINITY_DN64662_c0_g1_i1:77-466(+)
MGSGALRSWRQQPQSLLLRCAAALLLLLLPPHAEALEPPPPDFAQKVAPIIRDFVTQYYQDYGRGQVTLRHLKTQISARFGLKYEDLKDDRYSAIIEDETDGIVARCDGGKAPVACVKDAPLPGAKEEL